MSNENAQAAAWVCSECGAVICTGEDDAERERLRAHHAVECPALKPRLRVRATIDIGRLQAHYDAMRRGGAGADSAPTSALPDVARATGAPAAPAQKAVALPLFTDGET